MPTSSTSEYEEDQSKASEVSNLETLDASDCEISSEGSDDEEAAVGSLERFYNIFQEPSKQADLNQRMGEVC